MKIKDLTRFEDFVSTDKPYVFVFDTIKDYPLYQKIFNIEIYHRYPYSLIKFNKKETMEAICVLMMKFHENFIYTSPFKLLYTNPLKLLRPTSFKLVLNNEPIVYTLPFETPRSENIELFFYKIKNKIKEENEFFIKLTREDLFNTAAYTIVYFGAHENDSSQLHEILKIK